MSETFNGYRSILNFLQKFDISNFSVKRKNNHEYLYCIKEVFSKYGRGDFLQFVIDIETCKTVLPVYSSLRDSLIDLSDTFTLENLIKEEQQYKEIVDANMATISISTAEKVLLSAFDKINC